MTGLLAGIRVLKSEIAGNNAAFRVALDQRGRVHLPGVFVLRAVAQPGETVAELLVKERWALVYFSRARGRGYS